MVGGFRNGVLSSGRGLNVWRVLEGVACPPPLEVVAGDVELAAGGLQPGQLLQLLLDDSNRVRGSLILEAGSPV